MGPLHGGGTRLCGEGKPAQAFRGPGRTASPFDEQHAEVIAGGGTTCFGFGCQKLSGSRELSAPHGGSPYGSGTLAGPDGSRMPSDLEKQVAVHHGKHFGGVVAKLAK